jgi:hypothetical protein
MTNRQTKASKQIDRLMGRQVDRQTIGKQNGLAYRQTNYGQIDKQTDKLMDRHIDKLTYRDMDRQTDRITNDDCHFCLD